MEVATGLSAHIESKRRILADFLDPSSKIPRTLSRVSAATKVQDDSGIRRIRIRDFGLLSDSGPGLAGYDLGPSSPELFLSSLSSCLCHIFLTQAAVLDLGLDAVASKVEAVMLEGAGAFKHETIPGYPHDICYTVDVLSGESDGRLLQLWEAVRMHCPVFLLVSRAVPIAGTLRRISADAPPLILGTHQTTPA